MNISMLEKLINKYFDSMSEILIENEQEILIENEFFDVGNIDRK
jgi:hypothetical protein